jgi:hypothetical protein
VRRWRWLVPDRIDELQFDGVQAEIRRHAEVGDLDIGDGWLSLGVPALGSSEPMSISSGWLEV